MSNIIISIGRQFGSGGREIGKLLASKLGFEYYDHELLTLAAKEIGFDPEVFREADENKGLKHFLQHISDNLSNKSFYNNYYSSDMLFQVQSDTMLKLAHEQPCVIVGRCSDYVLRNESKCVTLFLHAPLEERIERVSKRMNVSTNKAMDIITTKDKRRAGYYNFYTGQTWGNAENYNLSINVSVFGIEKTADFILSYINFRFPDVFPLIKM